jgi:hypothetical protein
MKRFTVLFAALVVIAGCTESSEQSPAVSQSESFRKAGQEAFKQKGFEADRALAAEAPVVVAAGRLDEVPAPGKEAVERKIVYTATLRIVVEDFAPALERLEQLVKGQKGAFFAHADHTGSPGSPRSGTWTIRVPSEKLESFVAEVGKLGEVARNTLDTKDVTEEYYDVEADIRNKKVEEEAFLALEKTATTFDNVLAAKREVQRVRTEIDRLQKRLVVLANLTTLATVNLTLLERRDYVPETTTFGGTIARTWSGSINALSTFGKNLVLILVAVAPWLVTFAVVLVPLAWLVRRWWPLSTKS